MLIAGPCSAESEKQVLETARGIASLGRVDIFRCGIWKPRTRPGEFQGAGEKGLAWLRRVREETGLAVMVEVARAEHVEKCLAAGIGIMWIGSRTIVSPFAVEEIARALEGSDATVFVKNPVSPDLALWLGALERLEMHGIRKLAAVHRGFSVPGPGPYRNAPLWHLPLEFMERRPDIPMIGDPSHICGSRELLAAVARQSLDLGYHGLMIESHITPESALTDRGQQITPAALGELMEQVDAAVESPGNPSLDALRAEIDRLDDELIAVLAQRMAVSEKIGRLKKGLRMDIIDPQRWEEVLRDRLMKGELSGLDRDFLQSILKEIHNQSRSQQK